MKQADGRAEGSFGDPRVPLAAERTLLAWVRTGLAMMGFGFVVARFGLFLRELAAVRSGPAHHSSGVSLWIGAALVVLGVLVNLLASQEYVRFVRRYNRGEIRDPSVWSLGVAVTLLLAALGVVMTAYLVKEGL
jgi:putative membrane protein